eukprot:scaffold72703_cov17-Tisochrysis_lutea.AAC.3
MQSLACLYHDYWKGLRSLSHAQVVIGSLMKLAGGSPSFAGELKYVHIYAPSTESAALNLDISLVDCELSLDP